MMTIKKTLFAVGAAAGLLLSPLGAPAATAAARDGVCDNGELCYFYNSDYKGSVSDFGVADLANMGSTQPRCYDFKTPRKNGHLKCVQDNAASVWNRASGYWATIYANPGFSGSYVTLLPGQKMNLPSGLKNKNSSHRFSPMYRCQPGFSCPA